MVQAYGLFFGDVHVHGTNEFSTPVDGGTTSLLEQIDASLLWVAEQVVQHSPKFVCCMGDVGHIPGMLDAPSLKVIMHGYHALVDACEKVNAKFLCLVGNHDTSFSMDEAVHVVHSLHFLSNEHLVSFPRVVNVDPLPGWSGQICAIPYTKDYQFVERTLASNEPDCFVLHTDALGASWGMGRPAEFGVRMAAIANKHSFVFNGHHHHPENHGNWVQVGSLIARSFQDSVAKEPRGATLLMADRTLRRLINPHTDWFETIRSPGVQERLNLLTQVVPPEKLHLRLVLNPEEAETGVDTPSSLKSVKLLYSSPARTRSRLAGVTLASSPEDVFRQYAAVHELSDELVEFCLSVLRSVSSSTSQIASINFHSLEATNFLSFGHVFFDLSGPGLRLIEGRNQDSGSGESNGSGKSALVDILPWVLFNKTTRGLKGNDVVRRGTMDCRGEVQFERDGIIYKVVRGYEKTTGYLQLYVDGDDRSHPLKKMTEEAIGHALGMTEIDFMQICCLDISQKFMVLSDSEKKATIEAFSDVPIFASAFESAQKIHRSERPELDYDREERERIRLASAYEQRKSMYESLRQQEAVKVSEVARRKLEMSEAIGVQKNFIYQTQLQIHSLSERKSALDQDPRADLAEQQQITQTKLRSVGESLSKLRSNLSLLQNEYAHLSAIQAGVCPTCFQNAKLSADQQEALMGLPSRIHSAQQSVTAAANFYDQLDRRLTDTNMEYRAWSEEASRVRSSLSAAQAGLDGATQRLNSMERDLALLDGPIPPSPVLVDLEQSLPGLAVSLQDVELRVAALRKRVDLLNAAEKHLGAEGVRSYALDLCLDRLNSNLMFYAHKFSGDLQVFISPDKDLKTSTRKSNRLDVRVSPSHYAACSRGERARVDLIIQLALRKLREDSVGAPSLLVVDECDSHLDMGGTTALIQILDDMGDARVLFVTHNPLAKNFVQDIVVVVKQNSLSRLLE